MGDLQLTEDETVISFPCVLNQPYEKYVPKACTINEGCFCLFYPWVIFYKYGFVVSLSQSKVSHLPKESVPHSSPKPKAQTCAPALCQHHHSSGGTVSSNSDPAENKDLTCSPHQKLLRQIWSDPWSASSCNHVIAPVQTRKGMGTCRWKQGWGELLYLATPL